MKRPLIGTGLVIAVVLLMLALAPVTPVLAEFGVNWTAQFYNCTDFSCGAVATVLYPTGVNQSWGTGAPTDSTGNIISGVQSDGFSARFSSTQSFTAGTYDFTITSDDGFRLYIDGTLVLDKFVPRTVTTDIVPVTLTAGSHSIIVEYFDNTDTATIQIQYFLQGTATAEPTLSPQPIATGTVVYVRGLSVRTGPYLGASFITIARPDTAYEVSAKNTSEGLYTWYLIKVGDQMGWSSGRYLSVPNDSGAVIPEVPTIFDQIDNAPDIGVVGTTRAIMNFRIRPSIRTQRIAQIPWGAEVPIIGRTVQAGKNFWFQVRYEGRVGWIFAPYVSVRGPIDAVPVR